MIAGTARVRYNDQDKYNTVLKRKDENTIIIILENTAADFKSWNIGRGFCV
jgi:hypothetical protein